MYVYIVRTTVVVHTKLTRLYHIKHLVASSLYSPNPVVFTSAATTQMRLAELDPEIFRLPHHSLAPTKPLSSGQSPSRGSALHIDSTDPTS